MKFTQSCPALCDPMDCSTAGFHVHDQLQELAQTHAYLVGDAIPPSNPLPTFSPPTFNLSQHPGLFQTSWLPLGGLEVGGREGEAGYQGISYATEFPPKSLVAMSFIYWYSRQYSYFTVRMNILIGTVSQQLSINKHQWLIHLWKDNFKSYIFL